MPQDNNTEIAIIGGGAAGCFAAANVAATAGRVTIYERSTDLMQKVKVSGGGRCNVTNAEPDMSVFADKYPRGKQLLRKTLQQFGPQQTNAWFDQRGVKLKAEPDGRMFPVTDDSQTIIDCIRREMNKRGVVVKYQKIVETVVAEGHGFTLCFKDGSRAHADKVLLATGGLLKPGQFEWLTHMGHSVQPPLPSLFTFNLPNHPITKLMGVSVADVSLKINGTKIVTRGPLLITHWGMSGPAVLRASAFAAKELAERQYEFHYTVNWLRKTEAELKDDIAALRREKGKNQIVSGNVFGLPRRLWENLTSRAEVGPETRWGELSARSQQLLLQGLTSDVYGAKGKTTFKEEFVTCGGLTLAEINPNTMESRKQPGLYFAGEVMDVDGITGGFNFQHAWSSGWIAAKSISDGE